MDTNDKTLIAELRRDEGVEYEPYKDTAGIDTVGVGHNLKAHPLRLIYPISDDEVDAILAQDLERVFAGLDKNMPWWRGLTHARQRVLANMAFNLGTAGLMGFKNTMLYVQNGEYQKAADGMLASKWAKQVGARAKRLADMMVAG